MSEHVAHFFLKIEDHMSVNLKMLLKSIEAFSGLNTYYCTVMIPRGQNIIDRFIKERVDFVYYDNTKNLNPRWSGAIRYFLEAKSEVCILIDSDILIVDSIIDLIFKVKNENKIYACPAFLGYFSKYDWNFIFKEFNLLNNKFVKNIEGGYSPPNYFNTGFLITKKNLMYEIAPFIEKYVFLINNKNIKYKGQVALCLAMNESKIPYSHLEYNYNFGTHLTKDAIVDYKTESYYNYIINNLKIIHYCQERGKVFKENIMHHEALNKRMKKCLDFLKPKLL